MRPGCHREGLREWEGGSVHVLQVYLARVDTALYHVNVARRHFRERQKLLQSILMEGLKGATNRHRNRKIERVEQCLGSVRMAG